MDKVFIKATTTTWYSATHEAGKIYGETQLHESKVQQIFTPNQEILDRLVEAGLYNATVLNGNAPEAVTQELMKMVDAMQIAHPEQF